MPDHPLAEVFGFPVNNFSRGANRHRSNKLYPFGNKVPNCTKDKADNPLGVCSIFDEDKVVVTCPIRFRQERLILEDAAAFFFSPNAKWTFLPEVRLKDSQGKSAGNIDMVLIEYDSTGRILNFGALEIQAVYISGNIRRPFERYMRDPRAHVNMNWKQEAHYPRPDYLSSSRKRLAPQILAKGGILRAWNKKIGIVLDQNLFETLPKLTEAEANKADMAWFVYDLQLNRRQKTYSLVRHRTVFTTFDSALAQFTKSEPGELSEFVAQLQTKLKDQLIPDNSPDTHSLDFQS